MIPTIGTQDLRSQLAAQRFATVEASGEGGEFAQFLQKALDPKAPPVPENQQDTHRNQLKEAARQMEVQMVTMMYQSMEKASSEDGLLGDGNSAGLSHFKDMFFQKVAEEVVSRDGLGFADSLLNTYESRNLTT